VLPSPAMPLVLPPTSADLTDPACRPYCLWWTDATVADLRSHLSSADPEERAYWSGALLREANTRDVWLYVTPDDVRAQRDRLLRYWEHPRPVGLRPWPEGPRVAPRSRAPCLALSTAASSRSPPSSSYVPFTGHALELDLVHELVAGTAASRSAPTIVAVGRVVSVR
jgi:hypothetical protein